jgi:hypothetical protein
MPRFVIVQSGERASEPLKLPENCSHFVSARGPALRGSEGSGTGRSRHRAQINEPRRGHEKALRVPQIVCRAAAHRARRSI